GDDLASTSMACHFRGDGAGGPPLAGPGGLVGKSNALHCSSLLSMVGWIGLELATMRVFGASDRDAREPGEAGIATWLSDTGRRGGNQAIAGCLHARRREGKGWWRPGQGKG